MTVIPLDEEEIPDELLEAEADEPAETPEAPEADADEK